MEPILLTCRRCAGPIRLDETVLKSRICTCDHCGATMLIPYDHSRIESLYNRAEFHRLNCDFDKAVETYELLLEENNFDPSAHWGMVLSKYGIEYVQDPKTGDWTPTCHRTREDTLLSDPEYKAALQMADEQTRPVIEREAQRIHEIQSRILEISRREQPYDVFISYKEQDSDGSRTVDSTLAQDIYNELVKKGYHVFFARKTLEGKLGTEYEPLIYAALSTAKVLVVVGTKNEYINAPWVRNEWRRFQLMHPKTERTIIPAYRDMSPYDLPAELAELTALDMAKIGFMQDLTDGIERCLRGERQSSGGDRSYQNGETYLKLNNFKLAEETFAALTRESPEDYRGWWGLMVSRTEHFQKPAADPNELNQWFAYVKKLAPQEVAAEKQAEYLAYLRRIAPAAAAQEMQQVYDEVQRHNRKAASLQQSIAAKQNQMNEVAGEANRQAAEMDIAKEQAKINLEDAKSSLSGKITRMIFGGILIAVGILAACAGVLIRFPTGILPLAFGVVGAVLGVKLMMSGDGLSSSELSERVDNLQKHAEQLGAKRQETVDQAERHIANEMDNVRNLQKAIADEQAAAQACAQYLQAGADRIAQVVYADMCRAIGVSAPADAQLEALRKRVFASRSAAAGEDESVSIVCPACGSAITGSRSKMLKDGFVMCRHCGTRINVNS